MPTPRTKTCLLLAPKEPIASHLALFERMAQALQFELVRPAAGGDCTQAILDASIVLADVSGNDPEVLYWVGVAHTFGRRVFLVTDAVERLPYDLASSRAWLIDPASDNQEIQRAMAQFLQIPYAIGPVRVFLGKFAFFGENLIAPRFVAFLLDAACMLFVVGGIWYLTVRGQGLDVAEQAAMLLHGMNDDATREVRDTASAVMGGGVYVLLAYFAVSTWLLRATPGQLALGLRVVQADYRRVTLGQSVGRTVLSLLTLYTFGGGFLWVMRGPGHRALHDILSGTIVVRRHIV
jgi:uncharacterized RDD family membrane protein YckC